MHVLIADDDKTSRTMLELLLGKIGYQVEIVVNGEMAIERLLAPDAPELAIIDWMMPKVDGDQVCRAVRSQGPDLPVYIVILTSKTGATDIVRGLESGADDYMAKPFNVNELRARLRVGERIVALRKEVHQLRIELAAQTVVAAPSASAAPRRPPINCPPIPGEIVSQ